MPYVELDAFFCRKRFLALCFFLGLQFFFAVATANAQLIVAHRGSSEQAPENTIAAFELAWDHHADAIEADFCLTRDDKIVCIHDKTTERVSRADLTVAGSTAAELQALDVGSWKKECFANQRIPTVRDVLATVPDDKKIFIEIKCGPEIVPVLRRELTQSQLAPAQTIIISFQKDVIQTAKQAMPERMALWLTDFQWDEESKRWNPSVEGLIATAKTIKADGVDLNANQEAVDSELITACRVAGLSVHVWTVDEPDAACHFQRLGVDSITTNRPDVLREQLTPAATSFAPSSASTLDE